MTGQAWLRSVRSTAAAVVWSVSEEGGGRAAAPEVVSLSGGALFGSFVSVVMLLAQLLSHSGLNR